MQERIAAGPWPAQEFFTMRKPDSQAESRSSRRLIPLHIADLSAFAKALRQQLQQSQPPQRTPEAANQPVADDSNSPSLPGHQSLLNMVARAAGHRNLQALMAQAWALPRAPQAPLQAQPHDQVAPSEAIANGANPTRPVPADAEDWADFAAQDLPAAEEPTPAAAPLPLGASAAKALTQFDDWGRLTRWPHKFSVQRLAMWVLWTRFEHGRIYREREVNTVLRAWTLWGDPVTPRRELIEMGLLARKSDCSAYWKCAQTPPEEVRLLLRNLRARRPKAGQASARPAAHGSTASATPASAHASAQAPGRLAPLPPAVTDA